MSSGSTAYQQLIDAVCRRDSGFLRTHGPVVDRTPEVNAFRKAVEHGFDDVVEIVLGSGTEPNVRSPNDDTTPLMWAAAHGNVALAKRFMAAGAEVNATDYQGWTPLIYAAMHQHLPVVQLLVDAGADVARRDRYGNTALFYARRKAFKIGWPIIGPGFGHYRTLIDGPVARFLRDR